MARARKRGYARDLMMCPCCSGNSYNECCEPYHLGTRFPESALLLMRSRYSAYALNKPEYIIATTHPLNPLYQQDHHLWRSQIVSFCKQTRFKKLEILRVEEQENSAFVTFIAHLEQNHRNVSFQEKSRFEKVDGKWLYRDLKLLA